MSSADPGMQGATNLEQERTGPKSAGWSCGRLALTSAALLAAVLVGAVAGGFGVYVAARQSTIPWVSGQGQAAGTALPPATPISFDINTAITEAVSQVGPSVVTIINRLPTGEMGRGSGVIITESGHVVTNNHVVEGANRIQVVLADGTELDATLAGADPYADLAVVRVEGDLPPPAPWGNSDTLKPGETVVAIGSPLGNFVNTVTEGVVSNIGRDIDIGQGLQLQDMIQTDAAINRGNSGGPLINLAGQVVGINTLIVRGSAIQAEGLGFAIPSNTARAIATQLIQTGSVSRPYVGIQWRWITPNVSATFGLPVEFGAFVTQVVPNSPAEEAGIQQGDILIAINGQELNQDNPFINVLYEYEPGDRVTVTVLREGGQRQLDLALSERPEG